MPTSATLLPLVAAAGLFQSATIADVAWLQGCWQRLLPDGVLEERWTAPRGDNMLGVSRTVRGDTLVAYELVVLRVAAGVLAYEAHPSGQASARFTSRSVGDSLVVFENLAHDFPQGIGYRRTGDSLTAWIEGRVGEQPRRATFPYARVPCAE